MKTSEMQLPKLFVSFTGALYALKGGKVTQADLATGLFAFASTRNHVTHPGSQGEHVEEIVSDDPQRWLMLKTAVLVAEQQGRVIWRTLEEGNMSFEKIDELLKRNGYEPLADHEAYAQGRGYSVSNEYCYPAVVARSKQLEVVAF